MFQTMQRTRATNLSKHARAGLSLVELLTVISIIGVLLALTLPAIQRMRESARAVQCKNNLKQLALACEEFEGSFGHYPMGQMFDEYGSGPDSKAWSFLANPIRATGRTCNRFGANIPGEFTSRSGTVPSASSASTSTSSCIAAWRRSRGTSRSARCEDGSGE